MRINKINRAILNTVSAAALLTTGAFASKSETDEKRSWFSKVWQNPGKYAAKYVSHPLDTAGSFGRATKKTVANRGAQEKEDRIEEIASAAGTAVAAQLRMTLFSSPYEIFDKTTGKMSSNLVVLSKNSKAIESIFKLMTGSEIDTVLDNLPLPLRLAKGIIKTKLENLVFEHVFSALGQAGTKVAVKKVLYSAYGMGERYTAKLMQADEKNDESKALINSTLSSALTEVDAIVPSALTATQEKDLVNVQNISLNQDDSLTLNDVLNYYNHKIKLSINEMYKQALIKGIEVGTTMVTGMAYDESTRFIKKAMLGTSGAAFVSGAVFPPMLGVAGAGAMTTLMVEDHFNANKGAYVQKAADFATRVANRKLSGPLAINFEHEGKATVEKVNNIFDVDSKVKSTFHEVKSDSLLEEKEQDVFHDASGVNFYPEDGIVDIDDEMEQEKEADKLFVAAVEGNVTENLSKKLEQAQKVEAERRQVEVKQQSGKQTAKAEILGREVIVARQARIDDLNQSLKNKNTNMNSSLTFIDLGFNSQDPKEVGKELRDMGSSFYDVNVNVPTGTKYSDQQLTKVENQVGAVTSAAVKTASSWLGKLAFWSK